MPFPPPRVEHNTSQYSPAGLHHKQKFKLATIKSVHLSQQAAAEPQCPRDPDEHESYLKILVSQECVSFPELRKVIHGLRGILEFAMTFPCIQALDCTGRMCVIFTRFRT